MQFEVLQKTCQKAHSFYRIRLSLSKQTKQYLKEKYSIESDYLWIDLPKNLSLSSVCGTVNSKNRVHRGLYVCECGNVLNADVNAFVNMLKRVSSNLFGFQIDRGRGQLAHPTRVAICY
ncbi:MAG TPA: zinc ribbon domain-containing protein [Pseudothermotoga sp.]